MENQMDRQSGSANSLKDEAKQLGGKAGEKLVAAADSRKDQVTEPLRQVAGAVEAARDKLTEGDAATPDWLVSGLGQLATRVSGFADTLQNKDSSTLMRDVQDFAKQSPVAFLAACGAAGFAAARVLRASGSVETPRSEPQPEWSDGDVGSFASRPAADVNPMGAGAVT